MVEVVDGVFVYFGCRLCVEAVVGLTGRFKAELYLNVGLLRQKETRQIFSSLWFFSLNP